MRCPPRALNMTMDALIAMPLAPAVQPRACLTEKNPLTNRVRRHFARIKAVRGDGSHHGYCRNLTSARRPLAIRRIQMRLSRTLPATSGNVRAVSRSDQAADHTTADFGVGARTTGGFALDHPPGAAIGHQGRQHRVVELVTTTHRPIGAEQRQAGEREIADDIENLVTGALVAVTQPLAVEQAGFVKYHRILERRPKGEAGAPEPRDIAQASKGAGATDLAAEPLGSEVEHIALAADHRIGEVDFDLGAEAGRMGAQFAKRIAHRDLHWLQHLDKAARCGLCKDTSLIDRADEGRGAAVHDRDFRPVDLNGGV